MAKYIYLINPASDTPTYSGTEVYTSLGYNPTALIANLATTTVAAMAPDDFEVRICDEDISPADLDCPADFVGITGKSNQSNC